MLLSPSYLEAYHRAERILLESGIRSFPVNPVFLLRAQGIRLVTYRQFSQLNGTGVEELLKVSADGFSLCRDGTFLVVYNESVGSKGRRRWTLLHEFSHIALGHIGLDHPSLQQRREQTRRWMEAEADELTLCLIAPLPVAHMCGVETEQELRLLFGLSREAAANIFRDYCQAERNRKLTQLEFYPFVAELLPFVSEWLFRKWERRTSTARGKRYRGGRIDLRSLREAANPEIRKKE